MANRGFPEPGEQNYLAGRPSGGAAREKADRDPAQASAGWFGCAIRPWAHPRLGRVGRAGEGLHGRPGRPRRCRRGGLLQTRRLLATADRHPQQKTRIQTRVFRGRWEYRVALVARGGFSILSGARRQLSMDCAPDEPAEWNRPRVLQIPCRRASPKNLAPAAWFTARNGMAPPPGGAPLVVVPARKRAEGVGLRPRRGGTVVFCADGAVVPSAAAWWPAMLAQRLSDFGLHNRASRRSGSPPASDSWLRPQGAGETDRARARLRDRLGNGTRSAPPLASAFRPRCVRSSPRPEISGALRDTGDLAGAFRAGHQGGTGIRSVVFPDLGWARRRRRHVNEDPSEQIRGRRTPSEIRARTGKQPDGVKLLAQPQPAFWSVFGSKAGFFDGIRALRQ